MKKVLIKGAGTDFLSRRAVLKTGGAAVITGLTASAMLDMTASAQETQNVSSAERNNGPLGDRLQGVQHFGVTVQNMNRAYELHGGARRNRGDARRRFPR